MKIEKLKPYETIRNGIGDDNFCERITNKINEIIDALAEQSYVSNNSCFFNENLENRIEELENSVGNLQHYSRKELLNHLDKFKEKIENLEKRLDSTISLGELGCIKDRLSDLEQCPINDVRHCQPPKMCGLNFVAKEGTFEWALIQMKNGKAVFRYKKEYGRYFLRPSTVLNCLAFQVEGCDTEQWEPVSEQILATDWQVCE